ncbi:PEP-CTERM sorting domain-containing protein [Nonomuraea longispora]|uniref:PEP-CTERM sorting domain-containing protein n=1 Tax=Nonomuraea longispora TaxID=1848320 RepID=A0A4R4MY15_9ACTN|nr:DUF6203 family protein [Nonomuraea longispora]TDC01191.1 PEP-CTERM sorting domain-containing protein [Nonomuraea longispora]
MTKLFKLMAARWLARTPWGLALLGVGWFLNRRRRRQREEEEARRSQRQVTTHR